MNGLRAPASPRLDGSLPDEQHCYECGSSSLTALMDPVIRWNPGTLAAEYRFACRDLSECALRRAAVSA